MSKIILKIIDFYLKRWKVISIVPLELLYFIALYIEFKSSGVSTIIPTLCLGILEIFRSLCMGQELYWAIWKFCDKKPWHTYMIFFIITLGLGYKYLSLIISLFFGDFWHFCKIITKRN
ncbi:hypothetical protein C1645_769240 [Glomus cerebriforme]|uniref:Uncharacterized protein n=1 Tax=Glomus cerebriforme TaxID=658196 RepID=A0A397SXG6_9GLOM|nr:hypothetical protein C1645_769240 [Glomus cerebriforme]